MVALPGAVPSTSVHRVARGLVVRPQQESYNQIIIFPFPDKFSLSRAQLCSGGWTETEGGGEVQRNFVWMNCV